SDIIGHNVLASTACPGKNFRMTELRNLVSGGKVSEPKPSNPTGDAFIRKVQEWCCNYGYKVVVDGLKGPETRKALVKILQNELNKQFNAGLIVDGIPGPKTYTAVVNVRKGAKGNLTRVLQALLYMAGQNPGPFDGHFGDGTEKAVRAFQKAKGLSVDGIAGKATWKALL
ncbi:peptidoglycan-binding domain-containing protein, partial [Shouchella tritolerans]|uniref:peptidoglycan-binding domain-containing protein n=1 Tax=Shouchella tritolerans TaxID=2979466 RepID=UPI0021E80600